MHPRKFIRDSLGFAATQYVIRVLLIVRAIVSARLLGPTAYGAWNVLQLLMDYGLFASLGTHQGLDQAVPARIVEDDPVRLERIKRAGLFNVAVLTALFCALCLVYMLTNPNRVIGSWGLGGALLALACIALLNLAFYHLSILRSHGNIAAVGGWFMIQGLIGTVLGLALIPALGMWGLLIGWFVATLAATAFVRIQGRRLVPILPRRAPESRALLAIGFPMYVFTASTLVTRSIDRLVILKFLGTQALGLYSLAVMVLTFLLYLPDSIAFVLYPRLLHDYRAGENRPAAIRPAVERALLAISVMMPALCGVAYLLARDAVFLLLPDFRFGVTAIRVLCFGAGSLAFVSLSSIVLMTLGRHKLLIPAALAMLTLGAALDLWAIALGSAISGVARATLIAYVVSGAALLWLVLGGLGATWPERMRLLWRVHLPLAIGFVLAYGLGKLEPLSPGLGPLPRTLRAVGIATLFGVVYGVLVIPLVRGLGFKRAVLEFNLPFPLLGRRAEAPPS